MTWWRYTVLMFAMYGRSLFLEQCNVQVHPAKQIVDETNLTNSKMFTGKNF